MAFGYQQTEAGGFIDVARKLISVLKPTVILYPLITRMPCNIGDTGIRSLYYPLYIATGLHLLPSIHRSYLHIN